jgi:hydroxymethylbilane synthase
VRITKTLKIGTRGSALALRQTEMVVERIKKSYPGVAAEIVVIRTTGDRLQDVSLALIGGKGVFVKELEEALIRRDVDIAVHSVKDLPAESPEGLVIAAIPEREDPRDVLISRGNVKLERMPSGARIGTGSLRRACQLLNFLPDIQVVSIRGNLDTRIKKIDNENLDGIIVAAAGLRRMGWRDRISQYIPPEIIMPAVGQGALGLEVRADDSEIKELVAFLNDQKTAVEVAAERAFLKVFGAGCEIPLAAYAKIEKDELVISGLVGDFDGNEIIRDRIRGPVSENEVLGKLLAEDILAAGGQAIMDRICGMRTVH